VGPDALLACTTAFRRWLARKGYDVVWFMTGEKLMIGGGHLSRDDDWEGRLEISAVGCFVDGAWREWSVAFLNRGSGLRTRC
jgi:hypothetical protein